MARNRTTAFSIASCALISALVFSRGLGVHFQSPVLTTIRVGVDDSPPFYVLQPDGSVRGLAVDVLNEAAARRKIHLIWTPLHDLPLDQALKKHVVDIWPLVGHTAEREAAFYLSKPWLESDYILVSLKEHPIRTPAEAANTTVSHARLKFTGIVAHQYLSRSRLLVTHGRTDAIQAVCAGQASAALVERRVVESILLTRPPGCESTNFHISTVPGATTPLSLAAVPEARAAAAALREEITNLTKDGYLSARIDEWSPFSAEGARSLRAEQEADQRSAVYRYCLLLILLLAGILAWVAYRVWRLKQAAERAESGRREVQRRFTAFMENSPALSFMKDASGRILYVNRAWTELFNLPPERCYGKDDFDLWPHETARQIRANDLELLASDEPNQMIEAVPISPTESRDFLVIKFPFQNEKGERFVGGTALDITQREDAIRELAASEARYRELFEHNPLPSWVYDRGTLEFLAVNDAAVERYGWPRDVFTQNMKLPDLIETGESHNPDTGLADIDLAHATPGAWRHRTRDGLVLSVHVSGYELNYENRGARLLIVRDLTDQERTLEQLRVSEERWQLALRGAGDALWDWDLVTGRFFRSPRWHTMLGYPETSVSSSHADFLRLLHPDDTESTLAAVNGHLERRTSVFAAEYRMRHRDGSWRWIMDRGQAVWDERGRPLRMAGSQSDITERKRAEELLAIEARTDALTGLANRREFDRLLTGELGYARQNGLPLSVCVCDIDRFKDVNDNYGHAAGDTVLRGFASILRRSIRETDLLGRIGGDEFIIVLPQTTAQESRPRVEEIRRQLHSELFFSAGETFRVSGSFGIAELREDHQNAADLIAAADACLYEAKESGRNQTLAAA